MWWPSALVTKLPASTITHPTVTNNTGGFVVGGVAPVEARTTKRVSAGVCLAQIAIKIGGAGGADKHEVVQHAVLVDDSPS